MQFSYSAVKAQTAHIPVASMLGVCITVNNHDLQKQNLWGGTRFIFIKFLRGHLLKLQFEAP